MHQCNVSFFFFNWMKQPAIKCHIQWVQGASCYSQLARLFMAVKTQCGRSSRQTIDRLDWLTATVWHIGECMMIFVLARVFLVKNLLVLSSSVTTPCLLTLVILWMMFWGFTHCRSKTSSRDATPRIFCRLKQSMNWLNLKKQKTSLSYLFKCVCLYWVRVMYLQISCSSSAVSCRRSACCRPTGWFFPSDLRAGSTFSWNSQAELEEPPPTVFIVLLKRELTAVVLAHLHTSVSFSCFLILLNLKKLSLSLNEGLFLMVPEVAAGAGQGMGFRGELEGNLNNRGCL